MGRSFASRSLRVRAHRRTAPEHATRCTVFLHQIRMIKEQRYSVPKNQASVRCTRTGLRKLSMSVCVGEVINVVTVDREAREVVVR